MFFLYVSKPAALRGKQGPQKAVWRQGPPTKNKLKQQGIVSPFEGQFVDSVVKWEFVLFSMFRH